MNELKSKIIYVMGVSGSGKTSVGQLLAKQFNWAFIDADDYHSEANVKKMSQGVHLTDQDREPWLDQLRLLAIKHQDTGCVIACSALKQSYRDRLVRQIQNKVVWVYLKGSYEQIFDRMQKRQGHFMEPKMLTSQFDTLEEPKNAIEVDINPTPELIVESLSQRLKEKLKN